MWGKLCENSFSGWDEKNVNRNSTTLENKDWTNSHSIWEPIKSVKPKISSRDCCKSLKDSGSGATAENIAPALPKSAKCLNVHENQRGWGCHLSQAQQLHSPFVSAGENPTVLSSVGVWCKPSPVYLLSHTFQGGIRCPLGHHLRSTDRLW